MGTPDRSDLSHEEIIGVTDTVIENAAGGRSSVGLLEAALSYADMGWAVFPIWEVEPGGECSCGKPDCDSPGKHPRVARGFHEATTDQEQIRSWWTEWPGANVAIATGRDSGLVVLDVDPRHDGEESIAILEEHNGSLPDTLQSRTGGGGRHILFRHPGEVEVRCASGLGGYSGLDLRGDGGYIVAPPSTHASGQTYAWVGGQGCQLPLVARLASLHPCILGLREGDATRSGDTQDGEIPKGRRNSTLTRIAGSMRKQGATEESIRTALLIENGRCVPPLPEPEVAGIAKSIGRYAPEEKPRRHAVTVRLDSVEPEEVTFLWDPYLPNRKVVMLDGDPDLGKTFLALAISAAVTRGWSLPPVDGEGQQSEPREVLYLTAEDGIADTIRPRFDSMGGDPSRLSVLTGWQSTDGSSGSDITLSDLDVLRDACQHSPALVVLDPLFAFLGSSVDAHRANQTRPLMTGLLHLAEEIGCVVLCIRHLRKAEAAKAIQRGMGSIDFAAAVRSMLLVGEDPSSPNGRVMAHLKGNLSRKGPSLGYEITQQGEFRWTGVCDVTADDLLPGLGQRRPSAAEEAAKFLEDLLADGSVRSTAVEQRASSAGIPIRTLNRAKRALGVVSRKVGGEWWWEAGPDFKVARVPTDPLEEVGNLDLSPAEEPGQRG